MPKINPKERSENPTLPSGEYGLALVYFKRAVGKSSGVDYLRCKFEVTDGKHKGEHVWMTMSCDLSKSGAVNRWRIYAESVGLEHEFEVGDHRDGTAEEGDASIKRHFVGKAFRARVRTVQNGDYTNSDIESFVFQREWSPAQVSAMKAWEASFGAENDEFAPPDEEDDDQAWRPNAQVKPSNFDDDIPF